MRTINIIKSSLFVFVSLFALVTEASEKRFSAEVYENFHAGKTASKDLRDYIVAQDYVAALEDAEKSLLQLDLANADPKKIVAHIEKISEILAKHSDIEGLESDDSWFDWLETAFSDHDTFADFELNHPSRCDAQSENFKKFMTVATKQLPHANAQIIKKPMSQLWLETKESAHGETLMALTQQDFGAVLIINAILCVKMSNESQQHGTALRENRGMWVWTLEYSGASMHLYREQRVRQNLGSRYNEFMRQYNDAFENNRAWSYPGVVTYIPAFKDTRKALLNFVTDLQWHLKNSSKREAAAFAHERFVKQHFIKDGNGRMGRLLANVILEQANQKPLIVTSDPCYMQATEDGFDNLQRFVDFMDNPTCERSGRTEL